MTSFRGYEKISVENLDITAGYAFQVGVDYFGSPWHDGEEIANPSLPKEKQPMQGSNAQIAMLENYLLNRFRLTSIQAETVVISLQRVLRERPARKPVAGVIIYDFKNKYFRSPKRQRG